MTRQTAPVHYLRPNETVWTPSSVMFLDTETSVIPNSMPEVLSLRLWCSLLVDRRPTDSGKQQRLWGDGFTTGELVAEINRRLVGRTTVWLFAHNLSFDLVTTRLPLALVEAGWTINDAAVGGRSPWLRMGKGSKRLTMVDSGGWLPVPLADVAAAMGTAKTPLPQELATTDEWLTRCRTDVAILADAMCGLMDWWDEHELGNFTISGAASGWNAFRHMPTVSRVVVDPEPDLIKADRLAVHGGRRGVWRVGDVRGSRLLECDITSAYPRVAADLPLPLRRAYPVESLPVDHWVIDSDRWGVLAEVELETDTPRWPVRWHDATWFPTGRFKAHLAGPEIAEARRLGCLRAIGPGHVHQLGSAMMTWARWVLDVQDGLDPTAPPSARIAAKSWGRVVIGKWASHGFERTKMGPAPTLGWGYEEGWDHSAQARGGYVDLAGQRWWVTASEETDNAYPAILAWVESHVRLRLSRVIEALGTDTVIQCDTDGLIIRADHLREYGRRMAFGNHVKGTPRQAELAAIEALNALIYPLQIRVKKSYPWATVLGPQHVETPTERRFAGLPRHATRNDEGKYVGKLWPKLQWQMTNGDPRGYVRPDVSATIEGPYAAGWVTTTGRVIPPAAIIDADGNTELLPWALMPADVTQYQLAPKQHAELKTLTV